MSLPALGARAGGALASLCGALPLPSESSQAGSQPAGFLPSVFSALKWRSVLRGGAQRRRGLIGDSAGCAPAPSGGRAGRGVPWKAGAGPGRSCGISVSVAGFPGKFRGFLDIGLKIRASKLST